MKRMNANQLGREVMRLKAESEQLRNSLDEHHTVLQNSFPAFVSQTFGSELTSMDPLAWNNIYSPITLQYQILMYAYKSHSIIQNAIDMPVQDALRHGLAFRSAELDDEDIGKLEDFLEEIGFYATVKSAEVWARLFGGGAVLVNTDEDPATPLDILRLSGRRLKFYAASRWELGSGKRYQETYDFYGIKIHKSRVLTVAGKEAPFLIRRMLQDWGLSEYEKMHEPFNIYMRTQNAIYDLLKEAKVDVFKFKGFLAQLASAKGTSMAVNRVAGVNMGKNNGNALILDAEDDYQQKQVTFGGLAEVWKENRISIASALRIPMTKLFGISASGFSSGEDDIENYNAMVESEIREHMKSMLRALIQMIVVNQFGYEADIAFDFKPLRVLSSLDEENIKTQKHARYMGLYQAGMLTAQELMDVQQREKLIGIETEVAQGKEPEMPEGAGDEDAKDEND